MPNCPSCRAKNTMTPYMGWQFGKYMCKKCGYVGVIQLIEVEKPKKIKRKKKKTR